MKKYNGFSLVELMITLGIMSAVAVGYMQMMTQQTKQNKTNIANQEATNLHSEIRAYLGKSGVCDKTFEKIKLADNVNLESIKKKNGTTKYKVGQLYGNRAIKIKAISLMDIEEEIDNPLKVSAQLAFTLEKVGKVYGGKRVFRKVELDFILDKSDNVVTCAPLGMLSFDSLNLSNTPIVEAKDSTPSVDTKEEKAPTEQVPQVVQKPAENSPKVSEQKTTKKESAAETQSKIMNIIQKMSTDHTSVNPEDANKVQAVIDANPQLKEMQGMLKQMQDMQKQHQKFLEEVD